MLLNTLLCPGQPHLSVVLRLRNLDLQGQLGRLGGAGGPFPC